MLTDATRSSSRQRSAAARNALSLYFDGASRLALVVGSATAVVVLVVCVFFWPGNHGVNDFYNEAWPSYRALIHGHVGAFFRQGPAYVGSLILRAPFALLAGGLGGGARWVYFATALPCVLVAVCFGIWWARQQTAPEGKVRRVSPLVLCALNPVVILALVIGHPEELLGAVFVILAVILAVRGHAVPASVLTGLAVVNKSWALVAVPVVFVALPPGQRRAMLIMIGTAAVVLIPVLMLKQTTTASDAAAALGSQTGTTFQTPQLLWWAGPTSFLARDAHYLIVAIAIPCAAIWWLVRSKTAQSELLRSALLLLALVLLLRAALDPEDNVYYHVPFLLALMSYEAGSPARLTVLATTLLGFLVLVQSSFFNVSKDLQAGYYTAIAAAALAALAAYLFGHFGWSQGASAERPRPLSGAARPG